MIKLKITTKKEGNKYFTEETIEHAYEFDFDFLTETFQVRYLDEEKPTIKTFLTKEIRFIKGNEKRG